MEQAETKRPEVRIDVTSDRLAAKCQVLPRPGSDQQQIDADFLLAELAAADICFGIDSAAVQSLVAAYNAEGQAGDPVTVACGTAAEPQRYAPPAPPPGALTDTQAIERLRLLSPTNYLAFDDGVGHYEVACVAADQPIVTLTVANPARPGTGVDNQPIDPPAVKPPLRLGEGVSFDADAGVITARHAGVVCFDQGAVDVFPISFDGQASVAVAPNLLSASAELIPAGPGGEPLTLKSVNEQIAAAGVKMGLQAGVVEKALLGLEDAKQPVRCEIAQGRPAKDGTDAVLEYLVDMETSVVPAGDDSGRVDFKDLSVIKAVTEGQPLVRRHPGEKGVPGFTVTGKILPAYNGREVKLPRGRNVMADPEDPNLLVAKVDGNVRAVGGELEVSECFVVNGDVDYATGHIVYARSVNIRGDVKGGFNVEAGGDLEVGGSVEDSQIKCGGNVMVRRGFVGQGLGLIEAKGEVLIDFGRNQAVNCLGKLTIGREAINLSVRSRGTVNVAGLLVGGQISARDQIRCRVAGNDSGTRTELEVGVDHLLLEQRDALAQKIKGLRRRRLTAPAPRKGAGPDPPLMGGEVVELAEQDVPLNTEQLDAAVASLEEKRKLLLEQAYAIAHPSVVVADRVCPGVFVKIGSSAALKVTEELPGPVTFSLEEGEVTWH